MQFIQAGHLGEDSIVVNLLSKYLEINGIQFKNYFYKSKHFLGIFGYFFDYLNLKNKLKKLPFGKKVLIGFSVVDCLAMLSLRKTIEAKYVVYFNFGYPSKYSNNFFVNMFYNFFDKYCAKNADFVCCLSVNAYRRRVVMQKLSENKVIYLPDGVFLNEIGDIDLKKRVWQKKMVFVGNVSPDFLRLYSGFLKNSQITMDIIFENEVSKRMEKYRNDLELRDKVNFYGGLRVRQIKEYIKNFGGVGLIGDINRKDRIDYMNRDIIEVKEFLACGVPVIMPNASETASLIKDKKLGWVYDDIGELTAIFKQIENTNWQEYGEIIERILKMRSDLDLNIIFRKLLRKLK